jgi:dipeptidyl aminopeptidase/acylaminoacyl peptidase
VTKPISVETILYGLSLAGNPQISPDGARIAYERTSGKRGDKYPVTQLWVCDIDGANHRQLTWDGLGSSAPSWSPDGSWLAFVKKLEAGNALCLLPMTQGGDTREIVQHRSGISDLCWAPDGGGIAYLSLFDPANPDESPDEPIVRVVRQIEYKRDGLGLINEARPHVFVADIASGERRRVTEGVYFHADHAWSPDGTRLAVSAGGDGFTGRLRVLELESGNEIWGPDLAGSVANIAWSPDGREIAFSAELGHTAQPEIFLFDVVRQTARQLTTDLRVLPDAAPVWLDGQTLLLAGVERGGGGLYTLDTETGEIITSQHQESSRTGLSVDAAGRFAVQASSSLEHVGEINVYDIQSGSSNLVSAFSAPVLSETPMADWERFDVRRSGLTIEAWLLKPADFDPAKRYPVLIHVHGGPQGHYGYRFHQEMQLLATHGFLVVYANPRGSDSYGRHFTDLVIGDWGGEDYYDLMAALDAVLERPYADAERQGIIGLSYGGYMTAWAISHDDRFKAAVCSAPVIDLESNYGTSDIGATWNRLDYGGSPHENREWYSTHSPITWLHRAKTPTLLMCGEEDHRCPIGQSEQMFAALKLAGCEVEFRRYPGGAHGWAWDGPLAQREDVLQRTLEWFKQYLGEPV